MQSKQKSYPTNHKYFQFLATTRTQQILRRIFLPLFLAIPQFALASPFDSTLDYVVDLLTGTTMRSVAIIAVAGLGITALSGHIAMRWAISIVIGIVLIFGGATLVDEFAGTVN